MAPPLRTLRLSVQTKVLLVILSVLVLLPVATVWIVNRHITGQMLDESKQSLATAEGVFLESLEIRTRYLTSRFRSLVREPRFKANAGRNDPLTMTDYLAKDLLRELDEDIEILLYTPIQDIGTSGARREPSLSLDIFAESVEDLTAAAFAGEVATGTIALDARVFNVIAIPAAPNDEGPVTGVLTLGVRIGATAVHDLKSLTHAEVVILTEGRTAATTLPTGMATDTLIAALAQHPPAATSESDRSRIQVLLNGEHYLARVGQHESSASGRGFRYVLLSSYERRLQELEATRWTLVELSVIGILLSAMAVGLMVRRIIRPLRELRDSAEAVGRGDFSPRIERFSNDECGDLATAFNTMIANLQNSRAELEKTVETLKTTQAQLVQSEKLSAVGQFVAGVAHELNNPLTAVIGFSEILVQDEKDEKVRHNLDLIARSAHRCHRIVQSLLAFSRQHSTERKRVSINDLLADVLEIMAYDLRTSSIRVVQQLDPRLPSILADSHQLQQVIVNILSNARQAIEPLGRPGEITLRTHAADGWVHLEIQDNGPGIDPEHLAKIFDPFFTTKPVGQGTGLGLSLTYGIIQEHGGKISVRSAPGQGATFVIDLPAGAAEIAEPSVDPASDAASVPRTHLEGKLVLVIDDEPWILELVKELVEREGCVVETTSQGEKAVELMSTRRFDIVISDWKMPGMNGIRIHEEVAARDPAAARRMLFMTGDVVSDTFQVFLREHQRPCLSKPFSVEDFRKAVEALLQAARRETRSPAPFAR